MKPHHPSRVIAGAALLALVVSFLAPFPVLAEESPPPAEPTAETTLPPEAAAPESEATPAPVEDPLAPEGEPTEPVPTDAPTDEVAPADAAAPADPALAELIEAAPDGTTIAVVDDKGELLPLVSEEAAEVIAGGDPVWCPASVKAPTPGANGCSPGFWGADGMSDLIDYLSNNATEPAMDGIIWIEAGDHFDTLPIVLDGSVGGDIGFTTMSLYKLTLRGGWDPTTNKVIPGESSNFPVQLIIRNWHADVTLSDIVVEGATTAAGSNALEVNTTGNITLQRVRSESNDGNGAWLTNDAGTGNVTVTDGQFLDNDGVWGGLYAISRGKLTLSNVIAEGNSNGYGAYLDNANALTPQPVTISGLSEFNDNDDDGLYVNSLGAITAADLTASDNDGWGAELYNNAVGAAGAVTLTGTNIFTSNYSGGLNIASAGAIKLNSIIADSNNTGTGPGAQLVNTGATSNQPITLTGTSTFKYNASDGLYIASNGPVTLNNITASGNAGDKGLEISTSSSPTAGVTLTGTNSFNDNYDDGLYVYANGLIKLNSVTALGNGFGTGNGYGATLYNAASASRPGVTFTGTNNLSGNRYQGLYLLTRGPVAISNLTASDNSSYGADINNTASGTASPQKVTLSGKNVFAGNANNGLLVYSYGAIAASSLTVTGNGLASTGNPGAYLQNSWADPTKPQPITLSGVNLFTGNGRTGLEAYSLGAIKISSLTASGNGALGSFGNGADLSNSSAAKPGAGISLSGTNVLNDNHDTGLLAYSIGPITLANLTASHNGYDGVHAGTGLPASPQKITFTGAGVFNHNGDYGLNLGGNGAITLASLSASGNGDYGVYIYNASGDTAQPVTLSGAFSLNDNGSTGLFIQSYGAIKASNLTATGNGSNGASIGNAWPDRVGGISISGKNVFSDNFYAGLSVSSNGPITVSNLTANGNGTSGTSGNGADFYNAAAVTAQKIALTGTNQFLGNYSGGVYINASGAVSLSNISASNTINGNGLTLYNNNGFTAPVSVTGVSAFNDNYGHGLEATSWGAINLSTTRLEASRNGLTYGGGLRLFNHNALTPQKVTLTGTTVVNDNYADGLYVQSKGAISISSLTASDNGTAVSWGKGASISNDFDGAAGGVTLSGTNTLNDNWTSGLTINSRGAVTLNNLTATGNGFGASSGDGAAIDNVQFPAVPQAVKLTGINNLSGNFSAGVRISSNGPIAINSLTASDNAHSHGADLVNEYAGSVGGITLTGTNTFNGNYGTGLEAYSLGAISANNLTASGNGGYGTVLANFNALTPQAVKLTGTNTFTHNWQTGLDVSTDGAISINNLTASHNGLSGWGYGAYLLNYDGDLDTPAQNVTLTGSSTFAENDMDGLFISSDGVVALTKVYADGNGGSGLYVANNAGGVTVTCGSFVDNASYGVYAFTSGVLKLIGVVAASNNSLAGNIQLAGGGSLSLVRACPLG